MRGMNLRGPAVIEYWDVEVIRREHPEWLPIHPNRPEHSEYTEAQDEIMQDAGDALRKLLEG